jgi:hypothetical protein
MDSNRAAMASNGLTTCSPPDFGVLAGTFGDISVHSRAGRAPERVSVAVGYEERVLRAGSTREQDSPDIVLIVVGAGFLLAGGLPARRAFRGGTRWDRQADFSTPPS